MVMLPNLGGYSIEYKPCTRRAYYHRARVVLDNAGITTCFSCGTDSNLEAHHVDGDIANNELDNLLYLCKLCHMDLHNGVDFHG